MRDAKPPEYLMEILQRDALECIHLTLQQFLIFLLRWCHRERGYYSTQYNSIWWSVCRDHLLWLILKHLLTAPKTSSNNSISSLDNKNCLICHDINLIESKRPQYSFSPQNLRLTTEHEPKKNEKVGTKKNRMEKERQEW